jgi:hypothetical protein
MIDIYVRERRRVFLLVSIGMTYMVKDDGSWQPRSVLRYS